MMKVFALCAIALLPGCEAGGGSLDFPRISLLEPVSTGRPPEVDAKEEACRLARSGLGMPILVDPQLRSEVYASLGSQKANDLFRPVARSNNSFRCVCGTPAEKLKAKC